jgi:hypothetical protein
MEKALLEEHVRYGEARFRDKELVRPFVNRIYQDLAEIEAVIKHKTFDSCKTCEHYSSGKQSDNFGWEKCGWDWECKRKYEDRYDPKDNA